MSRRTAPGATATLLVSLVALATVGCTSSTPEAAPVEPCRATIDEAAQAAEIDDQIELLDTALVICRSVDVFTAHVDRYPGLIAWEVPTYLTNRCASAADTVRRSAICTSEAVAPPTAPPVEVPEVVYVGETLDGREIEIRPRAGRPFTNGTPTVIVEMADIAIESGCEGVEAEYERWNAQVEDALVGEEASVYAQHALNVLAFIQCDT